MSKKENPLLAQYKAKLEEEFRKTMVEVVAAYEARLAEKEAYYLQKLTIALQMGLDAGKMAANTVLGMGCGRSPAFENEYRNSMNEMAQLLVEDSKDDPDLVYSREVIDRRIKKIDGPDRFQPWDVRYNQRRDPNEQGETQKLQKS